MELSAIILLILLNICHWAGDYTHLSTNWMLSAKRTGCPLPPIFCHALIHGALIAVVLFFYTKWWLHLAAIEILTHFIIDVLKGRLNVWFPSLSSPANKYHWYIFGADQFLHQLIIIYIAFLTLNP